MSTPLGPTDIVAGNEPFIVSTSYKASDGACSASSSLSVTGTPPFGFCGYQETQPSAAEVPPARYREAGIKMGPVGDSDHNTGDDSASDTDYDHDSEDRGGWEYTRIVERWEDDNGRKWVKLEWADSLVLEKDMEELSETLNAYETQKISHWKDSRGHNAVTIKWADSWEPVENVKGLDKALSKYERREQITRERKQRHQKRMNNIRKRKHQ